MAILDIYTTGLQKQAVGHFANIVKLAKSDYKITEEENSFIEKMAIKLNIGLTTKNLVLKNPYLFPIQPPVHYEDRITRLYNLAKMIIADGKVALEEKKLLRKLAIGIGFPLSKAKRVCKKALKMVKQNKSLEDFIFEIKRVNRS
ncbi:hypothetical protein [uncultured Polaribacter sp.]|uniref:hypothetical protein n=1 Tax=uncultured Polaribacter sp. TaxID=174711 RepID=UPI002616734B|nr:hypothetical protein [uncultured Polaribacter sp.]